MLAALRPMIAQTTTPSDLSDEVCLACFGSRLLNLPLEKRETLATPEHFRLFGDILALTPPPPLVDAVCTAIDTALRQQARRNASGAIIWSERINTPYAKQVCTPALLKALCSLVAMGEEYASGDVFAVLRFFVDSEEFKRLDAATAEQLVLFGDAEESGEVRRAAQPVHVERVMEAYAAVPFPKPDVEIPEYGVPSFRALHPSDLKCRPTSHSSSPSPSASTSSSPSLLFFSPITPGFLSFPFPSSSSFRR
jgi:hypothetical protein